MHKHFLLLALLTSGCPMSVRPGDAGDGDAGRDSGMIADMDAGPAPADIIIRGSGLAGMEGAQARVRIVNTANFTASEWQTDQVVGGAFELTFPAAMPRDVFGVFADGFFDMGDATCADTEMPFRLFVNNDFSDGPMIADHADAGMSTCTEVTTDP